jgi:hypothetical protein
MATREKTPKAPPGGLVYAATSHPWSFAASVLLVALAYYAAAKFGLPFALVGRNVTPFWPQQASPSWRSSVLRWRAISGGR